MLTAPPKSTGALRHLLLLAPHCSRLFRPWATGALACAGWPSSTSMQSRPQAQAPTSPQRMWLIWSSRKTRRHTAAAISSWPGSSQGRHHTSFHTRGLSRYLVECVQRRLEGHEDAVIWLDVFVLCQHQQEDPVAAHQLLCDLQDLKGAVEGMQHTLVVVDPKGTVFTRAWCLLEMHTAVLAGRNSESESDSGKLQLLPYILDTAESGALSNMMYNVDVADSMSYMPEDRDRILEDIENTIGTVGFNGTLKHAFADAVMGMVSSLPSPSQERAQMAKSAASVLFDGGYDNEAEAGYRQALDNLRSIAGHCNADYAKTLCSLGNVLVRQDRLDEAQELYAEALDIQEKAVQSHWSDGDPRTAAALTLQKMAEMQDGKEAEATLHRALELLRSSVGPADAKVSMCLLDLEDKLEYSRYSEREQLCREAVRINHEMLGPDSPEAAYSMCKLAHVIEAHAEANAQDDGAQGDNERAAEAKGLFRRALEPHLRGKTHGGHPSSAATLHKLAGLLEYCGMIEEVVAVERKAMRIMKRAYGVNHPETADACERFALSVSSSEEAGAFDEGVEAMRASIRIRREALRPNHPSLANSLSLFAIMLRGDGSAPTAGDAEGEMLLREAIRIKTDEHGPNGDEMMCTDLANLAIILRNLGKVEEREECHRQALAVARANADDSSDTEELHDALADLAEFLDENGKGDEAEAMRAEANLLEGESSNDQSEAASEASSAAEESAAGSAAMLADDLLATISRDQEGSDTAAPFEAGGVLQRLPEKLGHRGVRVSWLLSFLRWAERSFPDGSLQFSTKQVVDVVVKRDTRSHLCAYCELSGVQMGPATYFVSHSWSQPFKDLVGSVSEHLGSMPDAFVWLDIFALCQHQDMDDSAAKQLICDLEDLESTVAAMDHVLVVVDQEGKIFTRAWCLLEMHSAIVGSMDEESSRGELRPGKLQLLPHLLDANNLSSVSSMMYSIDVCKAESYLPQDKEQILKSIETIHGAVQFNKMLKEGIIIAIEQLAGLHDDVFVDEEMADVEGSCEGSLDEDCEEGEQQQEEEAEDTDDSITAPENACDDAGNGEDSNMGCSSQAASSSEDTDVGQVGLKLLAGTLLTGMGSYERARTLLQKGRDDLRSKEIDITDSEYSGFYMFHRINTALGDVLLRQNEPQAAIRMYRQAIDAYTDAGEENLALSVMNNLAAAQEVMGDLEAAEQTYLSSYELVHARGGAEVCGLEPGFGGAILINLGSLRRKLGRFAEAKEALRQGIAESKEDYGPNHPLIGTALLSMGALHQELRELEEASGYFREAVQVYETAFGEGHPFTAMALGNLCQNLERRGELDEATEVLERAIPIVTSGEGEDRRVIMCQLLLSQAGILQARGDLHGAEAAFRSVLAAEEAADTEVDITASLCNLANLLATMRRFSEAEPLYERARDNCGRTFGDNHHRCAIIGTNMAKMHYLAGDQDKASPLLAWAGPILRQDLGDGHAATTEYIGTQARVLLAKGDLQGAKSLVPSMSPEDSLIVNAGICMASDEPHEAVKLYQEALEIQEAKHGQDHPDHQEILEGLSLALKAKGFVSEGEEALARVRAIVCKYTPPHKSKHKD